VGNATERSGGPRDHEDLDMATATISIQVDEDTARTFSEASAEERRKLQLLLNLRLRELTSGPVKPLRQVMDEIGAFAESQGLTPEILDSMLDEK
jgi:hypothetical protein